MGSIKSYIKRRNLIRGLKRSAKYGGEWDINDIGSVSLRMKDGSNREYLFFWPYGWKDGIHLSTQKIDSLMQCETIDDIYTLQEVSNGDNNI